MTVTITAHRHGHPPDRTSDGCHRLSAELMWLVEGPPDRITEVELRLASFCERVGAALLLRFGNAVGRFDGGPLGELVVHSDKWDEAHFEQMLSQICQRMALLPFSSGTSAHVDHRRDGRDDTPVLYHAFVYMRHLLSASTPTEDRLAPAVDLILSHPHRRFERVEVWSPLATATRLDPRALLGMVTPRARVAKMPDASTGRARQLAARLGGYLPQDVPETRIETSVDVPENQFVKAFLDHALDIVERMRVVATRLGEGSFPRRLVTDCDRLSRQLSVLRRHELWAEVSELRRVPAESQVLQRRRGYREVLRHWVRLRLTARIPLRAEAIRRLLEIKDIAELYEIWCFFEIERQVSHALQRPPLQAESAQVGDMGAQLGRGLRVAWEGGIELFYNLTYSRSRSNRSYSLPLRPDIVLRLPSGANQGDHLFDAKFKVRGLPSASSEDVDEATQSAERRGVFKNVDLYKMHAYRDAIEVARSVWILYPGSELRFFPETGAVAQEIDDVASPVVGVGAIALRPGEVDDTVLRLIRRMVAEE